MNQVFKNLMLEIADLDQQEARKGMQGAEGDDPTFMTQGTSGYSVRPASLSASLLKVVAMVSG